MLMLIYEYTIVWKFCMDGLQRPVLSVDGCLTPRDPRIHGYPWIGLDWID